MRIEPIVQMLSNFDIVKCLGEGGYGKVYLGRARNNYDGAAKNQMVAIKAISKLHTKSIKKELQDRTHVFLVLRFESNGCLFDLMNRHPKMAIDVAKNVIADVLLGLNFLHTNNIIHADLKPENVLLDENLRAHVADFGLCVLADGMRLFYGIHGSRRYQSPEQLIGNIPWDHRIDYFVVGVIFVQMLLDEHPFGESLDEIETNILNMKFTMPPLSDVAMSFLESTLCYQDKRLNVITAIRHPLFEPLIQKQRTTYFPSTTCFYGDLPTERFLDDDNFFPEISGLKFDKEPQDSLPNKLCGTNGKISESNSGVSCFIDSLQRRLHKFPATDVSTNGKSVNNKEPENVIMEPIVQLDESNSGVSCFLNDVQRRIHRFPARSSSNQLTIPIVAMSGTSATTFDLQRQLNKFPGTEGCAIRKVTSMTYKIRCTICTKSIKAAVIVRGKKQLKRRFNAQPFTRHIVLHNKPKNEKKRRCNVFGVIAV